MTEQRKQPVSDPVRRAAEEWGKKAHQDLRIARILLGYCEYDTVAFHVQQCAEKSLKGVLVVHQKEYPYTHDISEILKHVAMVDKPLSDASARASELTIYAIVTRYPNGEPVAEDGAQEALSIAGDVYARAKAYVAAFGVIWP